MGGLDEFVTLIKQHTLNYQATHADKVAILLINNLKLFKRKNTQKGERG